MQSPSKLGEEKKKKRIPKMNWSEREKKRIASHRIGRTASDTRKSDFFFLFLIYYFRTIDRNKSSVKHQKLWNVLFGSLISNSSRNDFFIFPMLKCLYAFYFTFSLSAIWCFCASSLDFQLHFFLLLLPLLLLQLYLVV